MSKHEVVIDVLISIHRIPGSLAKMKPEAVHEYNKFMLGVDRLDQRMSYYQYTRRTIRWWRKVFFWMIEVVVVNSYIIYTQHTDSRRKLTHKEFRRELVEVLCQPLRDISTHRQPARHDHTLECLRGHHFPENGSTRRDCRVCSTRGPGGTRHLTTTYCSTCSDHPHLCIGQCFRDYHTRVNL